MRPLAYVARANGLDGVKGCGILCPPHGRGAGRLVHEHGALLYRPTIAQRSDRNVWIVRYFVQPDHLWDWAFIGIQGRA